MCSPLIPGSAGACPPPQPSYRRGDEADVGLRFREHSSFTGWAARRQLRPVAKEADFKAVLKNPLAQEHMAAASSLGSTEPVLYEVASTTFEPNSSPPIEP